MDKQTEQQKQNKWTICRFCLKCTDEPKVISIFDADEGLISSIEDCGGIECPRNKKIPEAMCNKCLLLFKAAKKFRKLCKNSQERFKQFLNLDAEQTNATQEYIKIKAEKYADYNVCTIDSQSNSNTNVMEHMNVNANDFMQMQFQVEEEEEFANNDNAQECDFTITNAEYLDEESRDVQFLQVQSVKKPTVSATIANKRKRRSKVQFKKKKSADEFTYMCPECGNIYNEKAKLTLHLKNHSKVKPHVCEICGKSFAQTPQLARHMNSHTGQRPYKCKFCESRFADPSTCVKHQRIHTNERPYKCEICSKAFGYSNVLKIHLQTHTGEKPYECQFCGKKFTQVHHMKSHERTHRHGMDVLKVKDENSNEGTNVA